MSILFLESLVVKPEKQGELDAHFKREKAFMEAHPELFKELKSQKILVQTMGDSVGRYMEILELENLAEAEKWVNRLMANKEFAAIHSEALDFAVPATHTMTVWSPVQ